LILGSGCFYISVLTATYFIEHKLAREKTCPAMALINDNCQIKINDYCLSFVFVELGVQPK